MNDVLHWLMPTSPAYAVGNGPAVAYLGGAFGGQTLNPATAVLVPSWGDGPNRLGLTQFFRVDFSDFWGIFVAVGLSESSL
jgi:hypothetical protein